MQCPLRNRSASVPQLSQVMFVLIPAHARHTSVPLWRPGRRPSWPQSGQVPVVCRALVKQIPQIAPSGQ